MAYSKAWDETEPDGSEAANTIDTIVQDVKISIRERLEDLIPDWDDDSVDPKGLSRAAVSLNANESIATATGTDLPWDVEDSDNAGYWVIGSPTRITIPATGFYLIVAAVQWDTGTTGVRDCALRRNGSSTIGVTLGAYRASTNVRQTVTFLGALTAADYVTLEVSHSEGSNLNVIAGSHTRLSIVRLG